MPFSSDRASRRELGNEQGVALILVIICSGLMVLLGLSLSWNTSTDFTMSLESEAAEQAFYMADSGFGLAKQALRGADFNTLLSTATDVDQFLNFTVPAGATALNYFNRNPVPPLEALNIDFANPPARIGTRSVTGLLTPAAGSPVGTGRYFARLIDNDDGDGDPLADVDNTVILRVTGVHPVRAVQRDAYGTGSQNAIRTVEATLRRDQTFKLGSPMTFVGPTAVPFFGGNAFDVDGCPHDIDGNAIPGCPNPGTGVSVLNDDPPNDAGGAETSMCNGAAAKPGNFTGAPGGCATSPPSIGDDTGTVRGDPDAASLLDPNWFGDLIEGMKGAADISLGSGVHNSVTLGTRADPKITFIDGASTFNGNGSGAGVLVIDGPLSLMGNFDWEGLIICAGGLISGSAGNQDIVGGLITANPIENPPGSGNYTYGPNGVRITGNQDFMWSADALSAAVNILPLKVLQWREVLRELEPY